MKFSKNILRPRERPRISPLLVITLTFIICTVTFGNTYSSAWITEHGTGKGGYVLPPNLVKDGISFAGSRVPIERPGVHERIVEQLNYLLMDRHASVAEWFNRFVVYGPILADSLKKNNIPVDLVYLSVLLSELDPNHKTRSGGLGWWALGPSRDGCSRNGVPWLSTSDWDDRRDPEISTYIASQFLQTLQKKEPQHDWLFLISAFVDGIDKIEPILRKFPGFSYWDITTPPASDLLIPRLIALKIIHLNRNFYCIVVTQDQPLTFDNLDRIKLSKDLPLSLVAKWTVDIPRNIWELNPGSEILSAVLPKADKRAPNGYPLRVPRGAGTKINKLLQNEGYLAN